MKLAAVWIIFDAIFGVAAQAINIPVADLPLSDEGARRLAWRSFLPSSLKEAKLVGIGESGHAVAGFHLARGMMVRAAVEEQGVRTIFFEQAQMAVRPLRDLIASCAQPNSVEGPALGASQQIAAGTAKKRDQIEQVARQTLDLSTYGHVEFVQLLQWLCGWNAAHPQSAVSLHGVDLWDTVWGLRDVILSALNTAEVGEAPRALFETARQSCFYWKVSNSDEARSSDDFRYYSAHYRLEPVRLARCTGALKNLQFWVEDHRPDLEKKLGSTEVRDLLSALDAAQTRESVRDFQNVDFFRAMGQRAALQVRNIFRVGLEQKAIFLAHNVHVGKAMSAMRSDVVTPSDDYPGGVYISAGEILAGTIGPDYRAIGVGGLDLKSARDGQYPIPAHPRSLDFTLSRLCTSECVADVSGLSEFWWMHNETSPRGMWGVPAAQFDAYYFIRTSAPATPL